MALKQHGKSKRELNSSNECRLLSVLIFKVEIYYSSRPNIKGDVYKDCCMQGYFISLTSFVELFKNTSSIYRKEMMTVFS